MTGRETAWVIERASSEPSMPEYLSGGHRSAEWSTDNSKALRWQFEDDAASFADRARKWLGDVRICEHEWVGANSAPPSGATMERMSDGKLSDIRKAADSYDYSAEPAAVNDIRALIAEWKLDLFAPIQPGGSSQ